MKAVTRGSSFICRIAARMSAALAVSGRSMRTESSPICAESLCLPAT